MSIAVMNWVWANSSASGNERLVLLALADACSRDDGTGCWPSVATIARKANISDRTVRRVIARLEADGLVAVHRGGSRAGSTNSYTVVTGDRVIHSTGQDVTPDSLPGGDSGDRPPLTQPCQVTPDTAVSPDPPKNHQGTAAAHAHKTRRAAGVAAGRHEHGAYQENRRRHSRTPRQSVRTPQAPRGHGTAPSGMTIAPAQHSLGPGSTGKLRVWRTHRPPMLL